MFGKKKGLYTFEVWMLWTCKYIFDLCQTLQLMKNISVGGFHPLVKNQCRFSARFSRRNDQWAPKMSTIKRTRLKFFIKGENNLVKTIQWNLFRFSPNG
jgi:hypothetical protein